MGSVVPYLCVLTKLPCALSRRQPSADECAQQLQLRFVAENLEGRNLRIHTRFTPAKSFCLSYMKA